MNRAWAIFRSCPYISNVVGYTTLFASADLIQQSMLGGAQGRNVQLCEEASEQQASFTDTEDVTVAGQPQKAPKRSTARYESGHMYVD